MPSGAWTALGVWEDGSFRGVMIFGHGSGSSKHKFFGVKRGEVTELLRVAMRSHKTEVSRMLAIALRFIKKDFPHIKVVVSYTDPSVGHTGGVYKAGNWFFVGETPPDRQYWIEDRKEWVHSRTINNLSKTERARIKRTARVKLLTPKHRYAYPLCDELKNRLVEMAKHCKPKYNADATEEQSARAPLQVRGGGIASDPVAPIASDNIKGEA